MHDHTRRLPRTERPRRLPLWIGFLGFLAIALFFLWTEHRAHLLGALPFLLLLACPLMHLFMHGGHGQGHGHAADDHADVRPGAGSRS